MPFLQETIYNADGSVRHHKGAGLSDEDYAEATGAPMSSAPDKAPVSAPVEPPSQRVYIRHGKTVEKHAAMADAATPAPIAPKVKPAADAKVAPATGENN